MLKRVIILDVDVPSITIRIDRMDKNTLFLLVLVFLNFIFFSFNNDFTAKLQSRNNKILQTSPLIEQNYLLKPINCYRLTTKGGCENCIASKFVLFINKSISIQILEKIYIYISIPQNNVGRIVQFIFNDKTTACGDGYLLRNCFLDKDYLDLIIKNKRFYTYIFVRVFVDLLFIVS